ncbi:hypothetical protein THAOC_23806 [Thalassiosira oceanica]|uniref:Uncharacterized protein n=1 Tax=Thalassiosira oceanica TaxID=159749 RepID=K0RRC3_THAOC|nr:hypothetical protein THAOC_23806 [Thalassiosira oceanica]|eukprot:EJK56333.1 hypothetical protein THAOC_23806 [Thalassiosira oceanica]
MNQSIYRPLGLLRVGDLRGRNIRSRDLGLPGSFYVSILYDPARYADARASSELANVDVSSGCAHEIGSTVSPGITASPEWNSIEDSAELTHVKHMLPNITDILDHTRHEAAGSMGGSERKSSIGYPIPTPITERIREAVVASDNEPATNTRLSLLPWEESHGAVVLQVKYTEVLSSFFDNVLGEVVIPIAKLVGSGNKGVEGWFRVLEAGTKDCIPGDEPESPRSAPDPAGDGDAGSYQRSSSSGKGTAPPIEHPQVHVRVNFSPTVIAGDSALQKSDIEASKVICEEMARTASGKQSSGGSVIGSSLNTINTVRTLGGNLQNQLAFVVDLVEQGRNAFNFSSPQITIVLFVCLLALWSILATIPTRIIVLAVGLRNILLEVFLQAEADVSYVKTSFKFTRAHPFRAIADEDLRRTYFWEAKREGERERKKLAAAKRESRLEKLWKTQWHGTLKIKRNDPDTSLWRWESAFALIEGHRFIWWKSEKHFDTGEASEGSLFFAGHAGLSGLSPLDLRELPTGDIPSVVSIFGRGQQGQQKVTCLAPDHTAKQTLENAVIFASSDTKAD